MKQKLLQAMVVLLACLGAHAQVNSGSNGSDGAFNPTTNIVINMADHPTGIYHYTSVNIPSSVNRSDSPKSGLAETGFADFNQSVPTEVAQKAERDKSVPRQRLPGSAACIT